MANIQAVTDRTRLRCEMAVPSGLRHGRMLVQLRQPEPDVLELTPARGRGEASHQIVNIWGKPFITHLVEEDGGVSGELQRTGFWEPAESLALLSMARPGMTFVDAGANLGYYSALLAHTLQAQGQVYAFEPEPRNNLVLTANTLLLQQLYPQVASVAVFPLALGDRAGSARLNVFEQNSGMHSLVHGGKEAMGTVMVAVSPLDELAGSAENAVMRMFLFHF